MRHYGLGHVLMVAVLSVVPGTAIAVYTAQPTSSGDHLSDDELPFELGHRSPEHEVPDALTGAEWAEDVDSDPDGSDSSGEPEGDESDSTAPIVESLSASGIPEVALGAYVRGQDTIARDDPRCSLRWSLLAAIGRVETNHGRYGGAQLREDGSGTKPIRGIALDGRPGVALIRDTDNGKLDGDTTYDRAVGPMQFIPSTWRSVAADGNEDGDQDPDNIFDAALAASLYLCSGNTNLDDDNQLARAVFRYNHSQEYVDLVLSLAEAYENGFAPDLPDTGPTETPTEPLPEPVPEPANEGEPPGLSELSGTRQGGSRSTPTTSTLPRRPPASTTTTPPTSTTAPSSTTTIAPPPTTTPTPPPTTVPPDPEDPVEPECPDPDAGDSTSGEAEPGEPLDPECCASEPETDDALPPECCVSEPDSGEAEPGGPLDPECCASEPETDDAPPLECCVIELDSGDAEVATVPESTTTSVPAKESGIDDGLRPECCAAGNDPGDQQAGADPNGGSANDLVCRKEEPGE